MCRLNSLIAAIALGTLTAPAFAQSTIPDPAATPGIDRRLDNQERRTQQGIESGRLTSREATRLDRRQDKIQADVERAKADGVVTAQERRQVQRELDRSSHAIARQKHDPQHDYDRDGRTDRPRRK